MPRPSAHSAPQRLPVFRAPPNGQRALVWFRRDLRLEDNAALHYALSSHEQVWCVFVFEREILDPLPRRDRRVAFIHAALQEINARLQQLGPARFIVLHGHSRELIPVVAKRLGVQTVLANEDYEPQALARDRAVEQALEAQGQSLVCYKDQTLIAPNELYSGAGTPYTVFTPYGRAWRRLLDQDPNLVRAYPSAQRLDRLAAVPDDLGALPSLDALGFDAQALDGLALPTGSQGARQMLAQFAPRMERYDSQRDFPAVRGVSYLSAHNRFGTISVRELARTALQLEAGGAGEGARRWLSELAWRDFYFQILWHFPHVVGGSFRPEFDRIVWDDRDDLFDAWCQGQTGYPLVDAAQRQLLQTGFMHNRLRMVSASFLTKDLGIDWRRGEAWFALHLNDFDLAANNGGWQWAASSGCDAQPWFRIFNPITQSQKFDPEGHFIRRYVPELAKLDNKSIHAPWEAGLALSAAGVQLGKTYPHPIVDHAQARERTLARFEVVKRTGD